MENKPIKIEKVLKDSASLYKKFYLFLLLLFLLAESTNIPTYLGQEDQILPIYAGIIVYSLSHAIGTIYIDENRKLDITNLASKLLKRLIPLIAFSVLFTLLLIFGFILLIIPAVLVYIIFGTGYYYVLLENKGVLESFRLSRKLTKGNRMKILAISIIALIPFGVYAIFTPQTGEGYSLWLSLVAVASQSFILVLDYAVWKNLRVASATK